MNTLVSAITDYLEKVVKNFFLETSQGNQKVPQIIEGYLPPKRSGVVSDFPYIIVRPIEGEDFNDRATVVVALIIGTYSIDYSEGYKDVANIIWRIRTALLQQRVLEGIYRLEPPLKWSMFEDQPIEQWLGVITTTWVVPLPQEKLCAEEEARIYGQGY